MEQDTINNVQAVTAPKADTRIATDADTTINVPSINELTEIALNTYHNRAQRCIEFTTFGCRTLTAMFMSFFLIVLLIEASKTPRPDSSIVPDTDDSRHHHTPCNSADDDDSPEANQIDTNLLAGVGAGASCMALVTYALLDSYSLLYLKKKAITNAPRIQVPITTLDGESHPTEIPTLQTTDSIQKIVSDLIPDYNPLHDSLSLPLGATRRDRPQGPRVCLCNAPYRPVHDLYIIYDQNDDNQDIVLMRGGPNGQGSITIAGENPLNEEGPLNNDHDQAPLLEEDEALDHPALAHP